ncbi:MAG: cytochrome c oxidase accessory protein CcoG [Pirellulaceae bacterium]|nr:cytochrome c oxidase accessory protein CcoG [Pirellulaceae bacterium]
MNRSGREADHPHVHHTQSALDQSTQAEWMHEALLAAPEHVLSTLEHDGSRRWIFPKLATGTWWRRRRIVAYVLMLVFVLIPHLQIAERPLLRLDIVSREFTFFGQTFYPTDTLLLALMLLAVFLSIVFITAVTGRAWCGWACPQTVYMEFLFRPIDRLFEGTRGKGGPAKRKLSFLLAVARLGVYVLLSMFLAHTFLAYFVGPEKLSHWILHSSPLEHPTAFAVMALTTALMTFDFYYFREQTCLIACPYGRFQSVMLDRQSLIVAYDYNRGEPREKGKRRVGDGKGHCVDCHQCVAVCPTGIDIRNGLQMECVNCTQCIDACDAVMTKVHLPTGLIRFTSQAALENKKRRVVRARTIIYPVLLVAVIAGFVVALGMTSGFTANVLRGKGNPFSLTQDGMIMNRFSLRLTNRTQLDQQYSVIPVSPAEMVVGTVDDDQLTIAARKLGTIDLRITFPSGLTLGRGNVPAVVRIEDASGTRREVTFKLLGPRR